MKKKQITAPLGRQSQDSNIINIISYRVSLIFHECAAMTVRWSDSQPHLGLRHHY